MSLAGLASKKLSCLYATLFLFGFAYTSQSSAQNIDQTMDDFQFKLEQQQQEIQVLKEKLEALDNSHKETAEHVAGNTLDISGFFDFTVHTTNNSAHPFDLECKVYCYICYCPVS